MHGSSGLNSNQQFAQTPLDGLTRLANTSVYEPACSDHRCTNFYRDKIQLSLVNTDLVIICISAEYESGSYDRNTFNYLEHYLRLSKEITTLVTVPVVVLLFTGAPVQIEWLKKSTKIHTILSCFLPGQAVGDALYNTMTAATPDAIPAARLPFSWPLSIKKIPAMNDYKMNGRTYRYSKEPQLYLFGYGLSYTSFKYAKLNIKRNVINLKQNFIVTAEVSNTGALDADEVVQVYVNWQQAVIPSLPKIQLVAFKRVRINSRQTIKVKFKILSQNLMVWVDKHVGFSLLRTKMNLYLGGQQPNLQEVGLSSNVLKGVFTAF